MFTSRKPTSRSVLICSALTLAALLIGLAQWRGLKPAAAAPLTAFASCPAPQFGATANFVAGNIPRAVALSDFNLDGKDDAVVAYGAGFDLTVMIGNGDGTLQAGVNYTVGANPYGVAVGDFNQDGKPDVVA
ncbi:MAG TPA: VCBS repeat-containing protein, partial [Blastocatellia bacterium]|nr:VCBS repeat-containing protein [Blastocatellia bacterium]